MNRVPRVEPRVACPIHCCRQFLQQAVILCLLGGAACPIGSPVLRAADTTPPLAVSAATLPGSGSIGVRFNEALDSASVTNPANYQLNNGATVLAASLRAPSNTVQLTVSGYSYANAVLTLSNLRDWAGNAIAPNTPVTVEVAYLESLDVGVTGDPIARGNAVVPARTEVDVTAGGSAIWTTQDHFHFVAGWRHGDFDVKVRVDRMDRADHWSGGGLMARENLSPGSRYAFAAVNSPLGANAYGVSYRASQDGSAGSWPTISAGSSVPLSNAWIRLKRQGSALTAYFGTNGTDWTQYGALTLALPARVLLGLATTANVNAPGVTTVAWYRHFSDVTPGSNVPPAVADLLIKRAGESDAAYGSNNVYQLVPSGTQVEAQSASPLGTASYQVKVENDGTETNSFVVRASESSEAGWSTAYRFGTTNIAGQILGATGYMISNLPPAASRVITIDVSPGVVPNPGSLKTVTVRVFNDPFSPNARDAVQAATTAQPTVRPDLLLRREAGLESDLNFSGDNVYNATGSGQTKGQDVNAGAKATYQVQVANDGNQFDGVKLTGSAGEPGWTVTYLGGRKAGRFDGGDDILVAGNWSAGNRWTVEAWVKPSATPSGRRTIAGGFADCRDWGITMQERQFGVVVQPPGGCTTTIGAGELASPDVWYHVAGTCDGSNAVLYINGVRKTNGPSADYVGTPNGFRIGGEVCCGGNNFPGWIDEVRVWNRARTASEIQSTLNTVLTGREPGLIGYWRLEELGSFANDSSTNARHGLLYNGAAISTALEDVSTAVTGSGWTTPPIPPGGFAELMVETTPGPALAGGASQTVLLTGTSTMDNTKADTVKMVTTVTTTSAVPVSASFTTTEDFEQGRLMGLEATSVPNQLQLSPGAVTLPYIWIPNSSQGSVSKVDTRTGRELARYRTGPNANGNPSRTTVDQQGNCWVANRQTGSAIKFGLLENGQYLDRNFNGLPDTSTDLNGDGDITDNEMLPWGQDECALYEVILIPGREGTYTPGAYPGAYANDYWNPGPRGVAVDALGNVWLGTHSAMKYYYVDGATARILRTNDLASTGHTPYGAVIDARGILWSSGYRESGQNSVLRLDPGSNTWSAIAFEFHTYGLGLDRNDHLFVSGHQESKLARLNTLTGGRDWTINGFYRSRGVAVTDDGDVWVVGSQDGIVARFNNEGFLKTTLGVGPEPSGVAVDAAGKVWVVNNGDEFVRRIDPATDTVDLAKRIAGSSHYGYSDMTGIIARNATTRQGVWRMVHDAKVTNTVWMAMNWNGQDASGTNIVVRVRSSNDRHRWSAWETAHNAQRLVSTEPGRFLEIEVTLRRLADGASPVLYDLTATVAPPAASADVAVTIEASPDPVLNQHLLTYTVTARNLSTNWASGLRVTNTLPFSVELVSVAPSAGILQATNNVIAWSLAGLGPQTNATLTVVVIPQVVGLLVNLASITANEPDSAPGNNQAVRTSTVQAPPCAAPPMHLVAWWPGEGNANDLIGGNHGTLLNEARTAPGQVGQAFTNLNSQGNYVRVPRTPELNLAGSSTTLENWVYVRSFATEWAPLTAVQYGGFGGTWYNNSGKYLRAHAYENGNQVRYLDVPFVLPAQRWIHLAQVYRPDLSTLSLYVNGVLIGSGYGVITSDGNAAHTNAVFIGKGWRDTENFASYDAALDEVCVLGRALSQAEIESIYEARTSGKCKTTLFFNWPVATPDGIVGQDYAQTFSAEFGTPPYTFSRISGTLPPGLSLATNGVLSGVPTQAGAFSFTVQARDRANQTAQRNYTLTIRACQPWPAQLVAWWPGNGNADDAVHTNHGAAGAGVTYVPGVVGLAFRFVESGSSFVSLPNSPVWMPTNNQLTLECWIKPDFSITGNRGDTIISKRDGCGAFSYHFGVMKGWSSLIGNLYFGMSGVLQASVFSTNTIPNDGQFHHVAVTFNGQSPSNNVRFYIDGAIAGVFNGQQEMPATSWAPVLGRHGDCGYFSSASMDEIGLFHRELSQAEIQVSYQAGLAGKCVSPVADLLVKNSGESDAAYGLNNVYQTIPSGGQVRSQTTAPLLSASFHVKIENESATNRTLALRGLEDTNRFWTVTYRAGASDITAQMTGAGFTTASLPPGGSQVITVEITPGTRAPGLATKSVVVQALTDVGAQTTRDAVQLNTTVSPAYQPDLLVRRENDVVPVGDNLYNLTGAGQTKSAEIDLGSTARYVVQLVNDGNVTNRFNLTSPAGSAGWSVQSFAPRAALQFDGADDYVEVAHHPSLVATQAVTISFWAKRQRFGIDIALEKGNDWTLNQVNYGVALHDAYNRMFYFYFAGGWRGTDGVTDFAWHHYAVVAQQGQPDPVLYLDGVPRSIQHRGGAATVSLYPSTLPLHLGAQVGSYNYFGNLILDEVALYNRALTPQEITAHMNSAAALTAQNPVAYWPLDEGEGPIARDAGPNARHGLLTNGPGWTTLWDSVADLDARGDITPQLTGAGWSNIILPPGGSMECVLAVTPGPSVPGGASNTVLVTATSLADGSKRDAVKLVTFAIGLTNVPQAGQYTLNADFEEGRLNGVEYTSIAHQLQLGTRSLTFPYLWVPNSDRGSVSKVDTRTGREIGRYRVSPREDSSPSRTTVDLDGNCWVANRTTATAVKIGLFENGQYFDRNGNGVIDTSFDANGDGDITGSEMLPWGQDECVLFEVLLRPGLEATYLPNATNTVPYANDYWNPGPRGIAVDQRDNVWVGTYGTRTFYYIDGQTGQVLRTNDYSALNHTSYGAVIDPNGVLWSSGQDKRHVLRLDPVSNTATVVPMGHFLYGLNVDRFNHLFLTGWQESKLSRLNTLTTNLEWTANVYYESRGVAPTDDGDVWVAHSGPGTVVRYSSNGAVKAVIPVGSQPTGVAVDAAGKVWAVNVGDEYIQRIDPNTDAVDLSKRIIGATHYGYSDMTGITARNATVRRGAWSIVHNSRALNTPWGRLTWQSQEPPGTFLRVRARSSNDGRTWSLWETALNGYPLRATPPGKLLEAEVIFQSSQPGVSPILYDLTILPASELSLGVELYAHDFQGAIGSEWSAPIAATTPTGGRRFLGPFTNQTVTLSLTGLPPHVAVSVLYDLFLMRSWDGNATGAGLGPDEWEINVAGGARLLHTTFNNAPAGSAASGQAYPDAYPGGFHPALTGALETNSLGFTVAGGGVMDSVYRLLHVFPHSAGQLTLNFLSAGVSTGVADEGWGLDNVRVYVTPIAVPLRLVATGFSPQAGFQMRLLGEPQRTYIVQGSMNLDGWVSLSTNLLISGQLDLQDASARLDGYRFYRAVMAR